MKKYALFITLFVLAVTVAACAGPAAAPTSAPPTSAPAATNAPAATSAPAATNAPAATSAPAATNAPAATSAATAAATAVPQAVCNPLPNAMSPKAGDLGSADKPIVIVFVPSVDVSKITTGGQKLADCLGKMTGLTYKVLVGTSEAASVEAIGGGKAQMGFLNTLSILLAHQRYNVDVALVAQRKYGYQPTPGQYAAFDFDPDKAMVGQLTAFYKPEYFTRADTGIKTLADVKGHTFCFTSAGSTSGGVVPRAELKAIGIDPDKDIKGTFAGGHDKAAIGVYQGDCDAGVAFMDILTDVPTNLKGKFPDITDKVKVFAVGQRIPNDGLQFAKDLDPNIKAISVAGLMAMMADPGGNAVVYNIYAYNAFEQADYSKYYAPFEALLVKAGVDLSKLVKQ